MGLIADSFPRLCCPLPFGKGQWEEAEREGEGVVLGMSLEWGWEAWLPGAPKSQDVCPSGNTVLLGSLLAVPCQREGAIETLLFALFIPPLVYPSL